MPILGFYTNKEYIEGCKSSQKFGELQGRAEAGIKIRNEYDPQIKELEEQISLKNIAINKLVNEVNEDRKQELKALDLVIHRTKKRRVRQKYEKRKQEIYVRGIK